MSPDSASGHDKETIERKLRARIDQWRAELDRLEAKKREADADRQAEISRNADDLRARLDQADAKLKEMEGASGDAWDEVRRGAEKAWDEMDQAFERARDKFR